MLAAQILFLTLSVNAAPKIIDKPLNWTERRDELTREYSMKHYGFSATEIIPRAVVVHWTAGSTWESRGSHPPCKSMVQMHHTQKFS